MSDDVDATSSGGQGDDRPPGWRLTRRTFLAGCAAAAGAAAVTGKLVDDTFLGGLQPAAAATLTVAEQLVRTGHSNNCDGACGHLVHVADGKVKLVEGAPWGPKTIDGRTVPKAYPPRICLRGVSQLENLYSGDRIKYPYKRVGARGSGQWQRITWDEATTMIADNLQTVQTKYGKDAVWIAPYTGSLAILEGVVGIGFRFASVIGAVAGDFEGDNEGDSATPAGWNYVLVDPTNPSNAGGFFDGHESTDFLNAKAIVLWANNVAETSIPDWRVMKDAQAAGRHADRHRSAFHRHLRRFRRLAAGATGHRHGPDRRHHQLRHPEEAVRRTVPAQVHGRAVSGQSEDQEVAAHRRRRPERRRLRRGHRVRQDRARPREPATRSSWGPSRPARLRRRRRCRCWPTRWPSTRPSTPPRSPTSRPPTSSRWPSSGARRTRSPCGPALPCRTGTTATSPCRRCSPCRR